MTVTTDDDGGAEPERPVLDELFERLERMPAPEGYEVEIVEGSVHMTPRSWTGWGIIRKVLRQFEDQFGEEAEIDSDVRIDFPGHLNGFAPGRLTPPAPRRSASRTSGGRTARR